MSLFLSLPQLRIWSCVRGCEIGQRTVLRRRGATIGSLQVRVIVVWGGWRWRWRRWRRIGAQMWEWAIFLSLSRSVFSIANCVCSQFNSTSSSRIILPPPKYNLLPFSAQNFTWNRRFSTASVRVYNNDNNTNGNDNNDNLSSSYNLSVSASSFLSIFLPSSSSSSPLFHHLLRSNKEAGQANALLPALMN